MLVQILVFLLFARDSAQQTPATSPHPRESTTPEVRAADPIGQATMLADGSIVLDLYRPAPARVVFAPSDPRHREILQHIGEIRPGEQKVVAPWPDL